MSNRASSSFSRAATRAATRPVHFKITWANPISNETVAIRITHTRGYLRVGQDHIEIESTKPRRAPLPMTESGYRSHFLEATDLIKAGGPVTFVEAWLARESGAEPWRKRELARCQGNLFDWADAQTTATARNRSARPARARPAGSPKPDRGVA